MLPCSFFPDFLTPISFKYTMKTAYFTGFHRFLRILAVILKRFLLLIVMLLADENLI